jgi:hypothetical protein
MAELIRAWLPCSPSIDARVIRALTHLDAAPSGKWAPVDRPVRPSAGVYTGSATRCGSEVTRAWGLQQPT